jgi:RNA polymerase sigma factor (sigma-70 family)
MESAENFQEFIEHCRKGNREKIKILKTTTAQSIKQWCLKNKHEITWITNRSGLIKEIEFITECFDSCMKNIINNRYIDSFAKYRESAIKIAGEMIKTGFTLFITQLKKKDNRAWSVLHKTLFSRSYNWLRHKGIMDNEAIEIVFNDSVGRFYEKLIHNELDFDNASNLKSYFFKILELRCLEFFREGKKQDYTELNHSEVLKLPFEFDITMKIEEHEQNMQIIAAIDRLSDLEQNIITGFYYEKSSLREIALQLGKSEENVRVIKHRALKKLMDELKTREVA